jgi:hypothetical protein
MKLVTNTPQDETRAHGILFRHRAIENVECNARMQQAKQWPHVERIAELQRRGDVGCPPAGKELTQWR